jgi:homoserine O-acetyltransferase
MVENHLYKHSESIILESGEVLTNLEISYTTYGRLNADKSNIVWICHALTANADVLSWWPGLVGDNTFYNRNDYFIICANVLSSCYGTSGPTQINAETGEPYFLDFPLVTIRDMVSVHDILRKHLGFEKIHTCIGGSLGGQQALEWAIASPDLFENLILMATNAYHSPWGIAFNESQRMAIAADKTWQERRLDAGAEGLKAARAFALISYRNYSTYQFSQSENDVEKIDGFKAISYQNYQGEKLVKRFNCHSYYYLTRAMDSHNVGRGRGSVQNGLRRVKANTLCIGIRTDLLFPVSEQKVLAHGIPKAVYKEIDSLFGHDGFLIETDRITELIKDFYKLMVSSI